MRFSLDFLTALTLNVNLLVAAQAATKSGGSTKPSSLPGPSYEQVVLEVMAKQQVLVPERVRPSWDKDGTCSDKKCKGNQVTDRKDPEKCRDCPKGQKPNPENTKCIRDDTGCAEDEVQKDDKTCDKCPGTQVADSTGKKCINLAECTGNQTPDPDDNSKCKDCPAGQNPSPDNTRCLREDTGCADNEVQKDDKSCEKCEDGKKGDKDGKTCVDKKQDSNGKQGKCPNGQVLNPAKGGQDENTESPSCIPDDDSKCEDEKKAGTRSKKSASDTNATPECGVDDSPDFQCSDSKLYHHKKVNDDGKIEHSCRTTEKTEEDKKKKYDERTKTPNTQTPDSKDKDDKNKKKRRARAGWCFVEIAAMGLWDGPDLENMSDDEIDGLIELFVDDVPTPVNDDGGDGSIPEYMVMLKQHTVSVTGTEMETAGIFGWIGALAGSAARSVPKVIKGAPEGASKIVRDIKSGVRGSAGAKALQTAKQSKIVDRVRKSQEFRECIRSVALEVALGGLQNFEVRGANATDHWLLNVDWSRSDPGDVLLPEGKERIFIKGYDERHHDGTDYSGNIGSQSPGRWF